MPVCEAASISITSTWRPSMMAGQWMPGVARSMVGLSIPPSSGAVS